MPEINTCNLDEHHYLILVDAPVQRGRGKSFIIEDPNASRANKYVQSATLNGKPLHSFWFPAAELLKGGSRTNKYKVDSCLRAEGVSDARQQLLQTN